MAARLGARRDMEIGTRYQVRGEGVQLGGAIEPAPRNKMSCCTFILCCPCKSISWLYAHLFRSNLAAAFFI